MCVAQGFPLLLLGRALQGLGSGCSWSACSVYITEIAPPHVRGALVAIADISINVGILLGFAVDRLVNVSFEQAGVRWRVAMALSAVMPALYIVLYPRFPESPRWLVMQGREAEARRVLRWFTRSSEADAAEAVGAIAATARGERRVTWRALLDARVVPLRLLLLTCALGLGQQLTGTEAILYYTPAIINQCRADGSGGDGAAGGAAGGEAGGAELGGCTPAESVFLISLGVGACKLAGEIVAAALVETVGRRSTLVGSNLLVSLLVFSIALKFLWHWPTALGATSLCLVMLFFSLGPGPLTFVVVNEIVPLHLRAKLVALSVFFNRLGSGTIALTFLSLKEAVGTFASFSLYAALGLAVTLLYAAVPDMRGRSLEDADAAGGHGQGHGHGHGHGGSEPVSECPDRSLLSLPGTGLPAEPSDAPVDGTGGAHGGAMPGVVASRCGLA